MVFTALAAGSYYKGEAVGMFNMLAAWRFFVSSTQPPLSDDAHSVSARCHPLTSCLILKVGIGIGGEYPAGSVGAAESTGELKSGSRNLWFILFTNTMIDWVREASAVGLKPPNLDSSLLTATQGFVFGGLFTNSQAS